MSSWSKHGFPQIQWKHAEQLAGKLTTCLINYFSNFYVKVSFKQQSDLQVTELAIQNDRGQIGAQEMMNGFVGIGQFRTVAALKEFRKISNIFIENIMWKLYII